MKNIQTLSGLSPDNFREQIDNKETALYILRNESGAEVAITNYGAKIVSLMVPDKEGKMTDVVTGHDSIDAYLASEEPYFGAICGRYGNRIAKGKFSIDGITYDKLPINNGPNCLHGGIKGFNAVVWDATQVDERTIELRYTAADGEEGFPGELKTIVTYHLTDDNAVAIHYRATTDKPTVLNLTNHSYFNLSGNPTQPATDHILYVNADYYTPVDSTFMTTGEILPVKDTPMDFTTPKPVGQDIDKYDFIQLKNGNGYDHNWVLNTKGDIKQVAARLKSPVTGIVLDVYTNEPGVQVYTGNFLDGTVTGKKGIVYNQRASVCLETQHYPDSPNKPEWPSIVLEPGQTYQSECIFQFSVEK